ncbi:hypothetical protein [Metabacillus sp. B2-18]|uniref:hypothetical protein n=1 Tax=Metabacillus sp. B2-18 TaxID=2897333 RepID=UPI001E4344CC|nr:hypothetical protein [Metabacillus sp. B2-18]UGB30585.1 hypothetical protein LPC09_23295 [Metabacillus sp. B2-18]
MDYYGARRKRNIDLSKHRPHLNPIQTKAEEEAELEEGYEYEYEEIEGELVEEEMVTQHDYNEAINRVESEGKQMFIDGRPFIPKQQQKKQTFDDTHVRITTYLEKNVHQIVRMLQKQGQIESITKFVNDSIKAYLLNEFHDSNNQ